MGSLFGEEPPFPSCLPQFLVGVLLHLLFPDCIYGWIRYPPPSGWRVFVLLCLECLLVSFDWCPWLSFSWRWLSVALVVMGVGIEGGDWLFRQCNCNRGIDWSRWCGVACAKNDNHPCMILHVCICFGWDSFCLVAMIKWPVDVVKCAIVPVVFSF